MIISRLHLFFSVFSTLSCYFISLTNTQTPINTTWFDTNSNWTNTDSYIDGDLTTYHGWFSGDFNAIVWYRTFYCEEYSRVSVNFTCNYGCGVENVSGDGCTMYFNNPELMIFNTSDTVEVQYNSAYITDLTSQETAYSLCGPGKSHDQANNPEILFSETATQFLSQQIFNANEEFVVAFSTYSSVADITDEYLGISFISVTCTQVPSLQPTLIPTNIPTSSTLDPSSIPTSITDSPTIVQTSFSTALPTTIPTVQPTLSTTLPPNTNPTKNPTKNHTTVPTNIVTGIPTKDGSVNSGNNENNDSKVSIITIIISIVLSLVFFILFIISYYFYRKYKQLKENNEQMKSHETVGNDRILDERKSTEGQIEVLYDNVLSEEGIQGHTLGEISQKMQETTYV